MEAKTHGQEIDLLEVLVRFIDYLRKNFILTFFIPVLGAFAGWGFATLYKNDKEADMMLMTNILTMQQCDFLLTQLENSNGIFAMNPEVGGKLHQLKHQIFVEKIESAKATETKPDIHLVVTASFDNDALLAPLQTAIFQYLDNSLPADHQKKQRAAFHAKMIADIDHELASLEKLKSTVDEKTQTASMNPASLYTESVALLEKKLQYELLSEGDHAFTIVKGFDAQTARRAANPLTHIFAGAGAGILLLLVILFFKFLTEAYKQYRLQH